MPKNENDFYCEYIADTDVTNIQFHVSRLPKTGRFWENVDWPFFFKPSTWKSWGGRDEVGGGGWGRAWGILLWGCLSICQFVMWARYLDNYVSYLICLFCEQYSIFNFVILYGQAYCCWHNVLQNFSNFF